MARMLPFRAHGFPRGDLGGRMWRLGGRSHPNLTPTSPHPTLKQINKNNNYFYFSHPAPPNSILAQVPTPAQVIQVPLFDDKGGRVRIGRSCGFEPGWCIESAAWAKPLNNYCAVCNLEPALRAPRPRPPPGPRSAAPVHHISELPASRRSDRDLGLPSGPTAPTFDLRQGRQVGAP